MQESFELCPIWRRHFKTKLGNEYTDSSTVAVSNWDVAGLKEADNKIQQKVKSYNKNFACVMIWLNNNYIALVCL